MRTTLTLDDDVAAALERLRESRDQSFKELVNEALRLGLQTLASPSKPREPFRTKVVDLGPCKLANLDNIAEVLAIAEGEDYK
jgi:hypothetical protein